MEELQLLKYMYWHCTETEIEVENTFQDLVENWVKEDDNEEDNNEGNNDKYSDDEFDFDNISEDLMFMYELERNMNMLLS
ncbi:hypothetical protein Clacol_006092 [Clathrus columnatus]|uniref:Uncharacterized protein n=1 Tax=Clathrus columnatus TaxID=1419009 RepID=A0AAV5AF94_9AGAM|nr:hypothetical protein Clacol_006092 [Clathrus columnatus]